MASVFKRTRKKPIPNGAEIIERKRKPTKQEREASPELVEVVTRFAVWESRGRRRKAQLTPDGGAMLVEDPAYTVEWFDWQGRRKRTSGGADRDSAEALGAKLEADEMQRRRGLLDPAAERFAAQGRLKIRKHLADFRAALEARGNTPQHSQETYSQALKLIESCGAEYPADLTASAVQEALRSMRDEGRSLGTCNHYLRSIKSFSRWTQRDKRTREDTLTTLKAYNAATDPRHVRREASADELVWLILTTERRTRPEHSLSGPDRAIVYRLALGTGFRAKELRSLTPESFNLETDPPTVTPGHAKNDKLTPQPIRRELADLLRPWLAVRPVREWIFARLPLKTARMLRADLKAARAAWIESVPDGPEREARERSDFLRYENAAGEVFDFHATRHTYISAIVAGGASVKVAQELARHSTPTLTIGRYAHTRLHDLTAALESLPSTAPNGGHRETGVSELRRTGTDDVSAVKACQSARVYGERKGQHLGQQSGGKTWQNVADGGETVSSSTDELDLPQVLAMSRNDESRQALAAPGNQYPLGESNPCLRTENPMSWATRRRGQAALVGIDRLGG